MVFDRFWTGTTDWFSDAPGFIVDLLDPRGPNNERIAPVKDKALDTVSSEVFSFIQESILGASQQQVDTAVPGTPGGQLEQVQRPGAHASAFAGGTFDQPLMHALFGPEGIGGKAIGALPETIRSPARTVITPTLDAWSWTINEFVDRPLGTIATVMHDTVHSGDMKYLDVSAWQRAYEINDDRRTFGQSVAFAFMSSDPYDEDEWNAIRSDPNFNLLSGTLDFVQEFVDPVTYIGGTGLKVARGSTVVRTPVGTIARTRPGGMTTAALPGIPRIPRPVDTVFGTFGDEAARGATLRNVSQRRIQNFAGTNYSPLATAAGGGTVASKAYQQIEDVVSQLDSPQQRIEAFKAVVGPPARHLDDRALAMFGEASTPAARQYTMRIIGGDFSAFDELEQIAREMIDLQNKFFDVDEFINARNAFEAGELDSLLDIAPMNTGAAEDLARYAELQGSVNWYQIYEFQDSLFQSQQRGLVVDSSTGMYVPNDAARITMETMDQGLFMAALEDLIGLVDDTGTPFRNQLAMSNSLRMVPYGGRLRTLLRSHRRVLDTTGDEVVISHFVNPNSMFSGTIGPQGRLMRVLTSKTVQGTVNSADPNALEMINRILDDARRVRVVGSKRKSGTSKKDRSVWNGKTGTRLTDEAEVANLAGEFSRLFAEGNLAQIDVLFEEMVGRFNKRLDEMLDDASFDGIDTTERSVLASDYMKAQAEHESKHVEEISRAVSVQGDLPTLTDDAAAAGDDALSVQVSIDENGDRMVQAYRLSESQVRTSRVAPRYDVVQRKIETMENFSAKYARKAAEGTVVSGLRKGSDFVQGVWRGNMLLTPKWPMRVGLDEQLRMMVTMGAMATSVRTLRGYHDLRRALASRGLNNFEAVGDVTLIAEELFDILDVPKPRPGQAPDYFELFNRATDSQFNQAIRRVTQKQIVNRKNIKRSALSPAVKSGAVGVLYGDPFVAAGYFGYAMLSRSWRINQAARVKANLNYAAVLRRQAQISMIEAAGDVAGVRAARRVMSDADYIEELAKSSPQARTAMNQFEAAEMLMERAGFPRLAVGGVNARNAFGDDPKFVEQWRGMVSASRARDNIVSGAHKSAKRELEAFYTTPWERFDVLEDSAKAGFAEKFSRMMDQYTGDATRSPMYEIVWSDLPVDVRTEQLLDLLESNKVVWDDLFAPRQIDTFSPEELMEQAKYIIREYDSVLPPEYFGELRKQAQVGKVEWPEVRAAIEAYMEEASRLTRETAARQLDEAKAAEVVPGPQTEAAQAAVREAAKGVDFDTMVKAIREDYEHFGWSIGPGALTHNRAGTVIKMKSRAVELTDSLYELWGTLPTDNLARHPFFKAQYDLEVARRIEALVFDPDGKARVSQRQLDEIEDQARRHALKETRTVLYDLAENLRISELVGNHIPFLTAYGEVFSRWAGFAVTAPIEVLGKYRLYDKAWNAEALGLVEVEDPETGATYLVLNLARGDREALNGLPADIREMILPDFLTDNDYQIRISKDGLNTIASGTLPGVGPLISVGLEQAMLQYPQLEETLGFMFPFGHPDGNLLQRSTVGRSAGWTKAAFNFFAQDNIENQEIVLRMMDDIYTQRQLSGDPIDLGSGEEVQEWINEAYGRARDFNRFRIYAGLLSPSPLTLLSPFHQYVDEVRDLQREHGQREGTRLFLQEYGDEFFALTQRMTQLNDGVAASLRSELLYEENKDLVQAYPEIGAWITGSIGGSGEEYMFSSHVYWRQKQMTLKPGSDEARREVLSPHEYADSLEAAAGWKQFFDLQEFERIERTKMFEAGVEGPDAYVQTQNGRYVNPVSVLEQFKAAEIERIGDEFPVWEEEFNDLGSNMGTINAINSAFGAVLQDETLSLRPSARHILNYYELRYAVQTVLVQRDNRGGTDNIEAQSNADLLRYWQVESQKIGDRPEFSHVFDRFFTRDRLLSNTFIEPESFGSLLELP